MLVFLEHIHFSGSHIQRANILAASNVMFIKVGVFVID